MKRRTKSSDDEMKCLCVYCASIFAFIRGGSVGRGPTEPREDREGKEWKDLKIDLDED